LLVAVAALGLLVSLRLLVRVEANEIPTIELLVPPAFLAPLDRVRGLFGPSAESELVFISSSTPIEDARVAAIETAVAKVPGVTHTWSSLTRPRLASTDQGFALVSGPSSIPQPIDRFLRPSPNEAGIWLVMDQSTHSLTGGRRFVHDVRTALEQDEHGGEKIQILGSVSRRVDSWDVTAEDSHRLWPWLIGAVVVVPLLFFRSPIAVFFPLLIAGLTAAALFLVYRLVNGRVDAWALVIIPFVWSVATMDALHLYEGTSHKEADDDAVASTRKEVSLPAAVTAGTTALSLLTLAFPGSPPLLRIFGIWGAVGTGIAYAFTFTLGGALLRVFRARPIPPWSGRLVRHLGVVSRRRPIHVLGVWAAVLAVAVIGIRQLRVEPSYQHFFAPGTPPADATDSIQRSVGAELAPLEIYLEARTPKQRHPETLLLATLGLSDYLATIPEAKLTLSASTLFSEWVLTDPNARARLSNSRLIQHVDDPMLGEWLRLDNGVTRTQVLFTPMSFARKEEILDWITKYVANNSGGYRVTYGGPTYIEHVLEREGTGGIVWGGVTDLVLLTLIMAVLLRRARLVGVALIGNIAPIVLLLGAMGLARIPWSFDLLGLPMIVLGLAIDDTIHLLWPLRRAPPFGMGAALHRSIRMYGTAVVATACLLSASLAGLSLSGFGVNHALGVLLPTGLMFGLAAELTLVPACLALRRRPGRARYSRSS
jgi:predicted RND superfamily exporter protein